MHQKIKDTLYFDLLPRVLAQLVMGLMGTIKVDSIEGKEFEEEAIKASGGAVIYVSWHQRMSYLFYHLSHKGIHTLISPSRDGEMAARLALRLGFVPVRGSTTREGFKGLVQMIRHLKEGKKAGMLADGPQGPARQAKIGTVIMARDAQAPILPVTWGATKVWIANSWDRYMVPKPFSRLFIKYSEPIWVPRRAKKEELEHYRQVLEGVLNKLSKECDQFFK